MTLTLDRASLLRCLGADPSIQDTGKPIKFNLPISIRRRGIEAKFIINGGNGSPHRSSPDAALIDMIAKPHHWLASLASGQATSINDVALQQGLHPSDVTRALPLAFLAPDIVMAILVGRHPVELTANRLKLMYPLPADWTEQRRVLDFPQPASH